MTLYDLFSPVENLLAMKSELTKDPLGGTIELLPLCNMNCKMCFIHQSEKEMSKQGRLLSCKEWLRIANEAKERGVLYLLLTGGEPLLYPEFEKLYTELTDMGFIITINTNGTLINEHIANLFARRPCRRLNITIYGKDDETYYNLCQHPTGHTQLLQALALLQERKIPYRLNATMVPENINQLKDICQTALDFNVSLQAVGYMFPPIRRTNPFFSRLSSFEAAKVKIDSYRYLHSDDEFIKACKNTLKKLENPQKAFNETGITCRAGKSGFWMSWNGDLLPCGMFLKPRISLLNHSFSECWDYIVKETEKLNMCTDCKKCSKQNICHVCAAGCLTENGDMTKKPDYICAITNEYYQLLKKYSH